MNKFQIKQYIWLIILLISIPLTISQIASLYNFHPSTTALDLLPRALGTIAGLIVGEGLIIAVIIGILRVLSNISGVFKVKKYYWYDWLNLLAYSTLSMRLFDYFTKI